MPASPTPKRRKSNAASRGSNKASKASASKKAEAQAPVHALSPPSTPPRDRSKNAKDDSRIQHELSAMRTPISHKGFHMSPSSSLAHYKSNLDPPPVYNDASVKEETSAGNLDDVLRTPSRNQSNNASSSTMRAAITPVTPKKLVFFSSHGHGSPFRTPSGGSILGGSPFRTPSGSRGGIFDPHDPMTLLDEEMISLGNGGSGSSPSAGLYGRGLYASPNAFDGSPGKLSSRWW